MQRVIYLLFQIDEARKYIEQDRLESYRLALLLLDNAAELQLEFQIQDHIAHEEFLEKIQATILEKATYRPELKEKMPDSVKELAERTFLTRQQKKALDRYFAKKANLLASLGAIGQDLCEVLKRIHIYRNKAYHKAFVRRDTIKTEALILLDINCQLLINLHVPSLTLSGEDDYSWLFSRFELEPNNYMHLPSELLSKLVDKIRLGIIPSGETMAAILADNLSNRFADMFEALKFIAENALGISDLEEALRHCLYWEAVDKGEVQAPSLRNTTIDSFSSNYTIKKIAELRQYIEKVKSSINRIDAFREYSLIEKEIESLEDCIYKVAAGVDEQIQLEVDRRLGK